MSKQKNRRAPIMWVLAVGIVLSVAGIFGTFLGLQNATPEVVLLHLSQTVLVIGVMLTAFAILATYRVTVDEAYKFGYDLGHEDGYRDGRRVDRPTVVGFPSRRDNEEVRQQPE